MSLLLLQDVMTLFLYSGSFIAEWKKNHPIWVQEFKSFLLEDIKPVSKNEVSEISFPDARLLLLGQPSSVQLEPEQSDRLLEAGRQRAKSKQKWIVQVSQVVSCWSGVWLGGQVVSCLSKNPKGCSNLCACKVCKWQQFFTRPDV